MALFRRRLYEEKSTAILILRDAVTEDAELPAPASIRWEVGNAFSAMFKRQRISAAEARSAFRSFEQIPIRLIDLDIDAAIALAARYDIYGYDAYMIACAQERIAPLLALDRGLVRAAKNAGEDLVEVPR